MNLKSEAQWNRIKIVFEEPSLNPRLATAIGTALTKQQGLVRR